MTPEMRYSFRAALWGTMAGGVICEALSWVMKNPAYPIVLAAVALLGVGWLVDASTREPKPLAGPPAGFEDGTYVGDGVWVRHGNKKDSPPIKDGVGR